MAEEEEVRGQTSEVGVELRAAVREVMGEFIESQRRTETLEKRVNELIAENQEAQRSSAIRAELQKLGVAKIDLAYKAVKEDAARLQGSDELRDYLTNFVNENPELLPARLTGGSGASSSSRVPGAAEGIDLASIRPGMSAEEMDRVRREVARVASQTLKGWQ
jgi:dGTP triphosphohydrolase